MRRTTVTGTMCNARGATALDAPTRRGAPQNPTKIRRNRRAVSALRGAGGRGSAPVADVDEVARDCRRSRHRRRHEVRAALEALATLEIAVRGRGAPLLRLQLVRIHRKAHRAARLAPFETGLDEDLVEPFRFGLCLHE